MQGKKENNTQYGVSVVHFALTLLTALNNDISSSLISPTNELQNQKSESD